MTQALKGRKLLLVGFTLFSMFFGAGNLIFPPDLGAKAGVNLWPAFLGLAISAVGLPVAGVIAVARARRGAPGGGGPRGGRGPPAANWGPPAPPPPPQAPLLPCSPRCWAAAPDCWQASF